MASDSSPAKTPDVPSSPDDSFSSPIGNTFSSDGGDSSRRKRCRRSTALNLTLRHTRSHPNSTGRQTRGGARRTPSASTPVAATPTSTDDFPPSSEGGEPEDADEAPPMYVWGTNISVQDVNAAILRFLRHFREHPLHDEGKYMRAIHSVIEMEGESLEVDAQDVFDYDNELYTKMVRYPLEVLAIFDIVLMDMVSRKSDRQEKCI